MTRLQERRLCAWCDGKIRRAARSDAKTCSKACRQAKHRFKVHPASAAALSPKAFAYADPPYPGLARKYYGSTEVNHPLLIGTLMRDYPDGWALSTSSDALQAVLAMCPAGVRVASWHRTERRGLAYRPRDSWEPLIVWCGRVRRIDATEACANTLVGGGRQRSHPGALIGMKPAAFAEWMFKQLGALRGDTLADIFPGSGAIARAWNLFQAAPRDASVHASTNDTSQPCATPAPNDTKPLLDRGTTGDGGAERQLADPPGGNDASREYSGHESLPPAETTDDPSAPCDASVGTGAT